VEHGSVKQLYDEIGLDANAIATVLREMLKDKVTIAQTTFQ
jgi:hypothetical protein